MNRLIPILLALLLCIPARAQERALLENTFLSVGVGLNGYGNDRYGALDNRALHLEGALGYQLTNTVALRARLLGMSNVGPSGKTSLYAYGFADLMWDATSCLMGFNPKRICTAHLIYGVGIVHASGDNDFALSLGARLQARPSRIAALFAEVKTTVHPCEFDGNQSWSFAPAATAGVSLFINENIASHRATPNMPNSRSDWYFGLGLLGVNSFQYSDIPTIGDRLRQLQPALQFNVGKSVTPCWGVRLTLAGGQSAYRDFDSDTETLTNKILFRYATLHGDLLLNLSQAILQARHLPRFSLSPYLGAGVLIRSDYLGECRMGLDMGLMARMVVADRGDLFLDLRYCLTESRFAHLSGFSQSRFGVGIASLNLGYIVNIGESRFRSTRY